MTDETSRDKNSSINEQYFPTCWCWIGKPTPYWVMVFGCILVVFGGFWLLTSLDLLPKLFENALGPVIVILIGLAYLVNGFVLRK